MEVGRGGDKNPLIRGRIILVAFFKDFFGCSDPRASSKSIDRVVEDNRTDHVTPLG